MPITTLNSADKTRRIEAVLSRIKQGKSTMICAVFYTFGLCRRLVDFME